jgi:AraC-like DNA-binding protein
MRATASSRGLFEQGRLADRRLDGPQREPPTGAVESWTNESLAREVSVSRATLSRRFTHLVGEAPAQYLTRWRMDVAAQRLRDAHDTVGAIAAAVGYRSEYSFSRAFTRHRGIAPGRYRRHARERALAAA